MNRSSMPEDVRAKIRSLFAPPPPTPDQVRAACHAPPPNRRVGTTRDVLARLNADHPELFPYALRLVATRPADVPDTTDRAQVEREIRATMAAVRLLAYRRERVQLETYLNDQPTDAMARQRVLDLTTAAHELERRFPGCAQRAQLALAREGGAPSRRAPVAQRNSEQETTT